MEKKNKILTYLAGTLALLGICMLFLPCGIFKNETDTYQTLGMPMFFGYSMNGNHIFNYNILGLISLVFITLSIIFDMTTLLKTNNNFLSGSLMLCGTLLFIITGLNVNVVQPEAANDFTLLFPFYLASAFLVCSTIIIVIKPYITKDKKKENK